MEKGRSVLKELQEKEQEMLVEWADILRQNKIPYFVACGTALGTVRHKGFIPWDDDVDIYVFGKDYKRVKEALLNKKDANIEFHDYSTQKNYPYCFPKVIAKNTLLEEGSVRYDEYSCGVYIDIFLLSEVSSNPVVRFFQEKRRYFNYALLRAYYYEYEGYRKVFSHLARLLVKPEKVQKKLVKCYERSVKEAKYVVDISGFKKNYFWEKTMFKESTTLPFNGMMVSVPKDYTGYLKHRYGDYMKYPPVEQRTSGHNFISLIIDGRKII